MDFRLPTAAFAPPGFATLGGLNVAPEPTAVAAPAAPPAAAPALAPEQPAPAAVDIDNVNLDADELRALDNMMQTYLADGTMSADEQTVYQQVRGQFAKSGAATAGEEPTAGAGPTPEEGLPEQTIDSPTSEETAESGAPSDDPLGGAGPTESGASLSDLGGSIEDDKKIEDTPPPPPPPPGPDPAALMMMMQMMTGDPVALDLNHDGKIGTTGNSTARDRKDAHMGKTVDFDLNADGVKEKVEWMDGQGDGWLVDDRDGGVSKAAAGSGEIDGSRLFGDEGGKYAHGYVKLARHDANQDGKLTGKELEGLKTWVDDGDAKVEAGELKSLAEQGITELSTQMNLQKNARGEDLMRSSFVQNGKTRMSEDVWLRTA